MNTKRRVSTLVCVLGFCVVALGAGGGQKPSTPIALPAHVPRLLLTAKTVFISNIGGGCDPYEPPTRGTPANAGEVAYEEFYAGVKDWGRYSIQPDPGQAELNFEVEVECLTAPGVSGAYPQDPAVKVIIRDMKSRAVLWGITEYVEGTAHGDHFTKNLNTAIRALLTRVRELVGPPGPASTPNE